MKENIFMCIYLQRHVTRIYKEPLKITQKNSNNPIKQQAKDLKGHFTKRISKCLINI